MPLTISAASQLKSLRAKAGDIRTRTLELNQAVADGTPLTDEQRAELKSLREQAASVNEALAIAEEANEAERRAGGVTDPDAAAARAAVNAVVSSATPSPTTP